MKKLTPFKGKEEQFTHLFDWISHEEDHRDLVFVCNGEKVGYHRSVVSPHSLLLSQLFRLYTCTYTWCSSDIVISLDNVDKVVLKYVMDCVYTGRYGLANFILFYI